MAENWGIIEVEKMADGMVLRKAGMTEMPMDSWMVLRMVLRRAAKTVALMDSYWAVL
jgi:hypothetical protein